MRSSRSDLFGGLLANLERDQRARAAALGFASVDEMARDERRREEVARVAERRREIVDSLGSRLTDRAGELIKRGALEMTDAIRIAREWAATTKPVLVLSGDPGTGKTLAALDVVASGLGAWQFVRAARLGSMYERWQNDREDDLERLRFAIPWMVVDDLGQESIEDRRVMPAVHELLDSRKSSRTRTIITTNLTAAMARKRYEAPDISRLAESALWVALDGEDMRRAKR